MASSGRRDLTLSRLNRPGVLRRGSWFFFLCLAFHIQTPIASALDCSGSCANDTDCSSNPCHYCDGTFFCADCCLIPDQDSCDLQSACAWTSNECRNTSGTACGASVPEIPWSFRHYFFGGLLLSSLGLLFYFSRRRRPKSTV